jgi:hypothetical protein
MKEHKRKIRDRIMSETWEREKDKMTMPELAEVFNCPVPSFCRIIKNYNEKENGTNK